MPNDPNDERYQTWSETISEYSVPPYKGFVCITHFHKDDYVIVKNRGEEKITLKKNAIPTIFQSSSNALMTNAHNFDGNISDDEVVSPVSPAQVTENQSNKNFENLRIKCCDSIELLSILKLEHSDLRQKYIELEAEKCVQIAHLEKENKKLKMNAEIQKTHIKYLSKKVYRKEKSEQKLKDLLKDLKEECILSAEAYEALEVI